MTATQLFSDNFDTGTSLSTAWTATNGATGSGLSTARYVSSPQSFYIGGGGLPNTVSRALGVQVSTGYLQLDLFKVSYLNGSTAGGGFCIQLTDSVAGAAQLSLGIDQMGLATLYLGAYGGTALGSFPMFVDIWHVVILSAHIDPTNGWAQVAVDGELFLNFSGNTQNTTHAYFDIVGFSCATAGQSPTAYAFIDNCAAYSGLPLGLVPSQSAAGWSDNFDSYSGSVSASPWQNGCPLSTAIYNSAPQSAEIGNGGTFTTFPRAIAPLVNGSVSVQWRQVSASSSSTALTLLDMIAGAAQITLQMNQSGTHSAYLGSTSGTLLGSFTMGVDAFHLLEVDLTIDPNTGSLVVKVDGAIALTYTGNTRATANTVWHQINFTGGNIGPYPPAEAYIDDVTASGTITALSASLWRGSGGGTPAQALAQPQVFFLI